MWSKRFEKEQPESDLSRSAYNTKLSDDRSPKTIGNNRRKSSGSGEDHRDAIDKESSINKVCLNVNTNNNSKRRSSSPSLPSSTNKAPRLSLDNSAKKLLKEPIGNSKGLLDVLDLVSLQRQAMQLACLQQHQATAGLKSGAPLSPGEDSNSRTKSMAAAIAAAGVLPNTVAGLPTQMQQLLTQQVLSPSQLQAFMQQHAMSAQQQQAQQIQELYRQQQKHIQDFQIQLAAAKHQQKSAPTSSLPRSDETIETSNGNVLASKIAKDQQQQMQQHLALQQLMQLQQIQQQQQQQHQQQQAAAAALQQQSIAAAVAMAQGRQQSFMPPEVSNDLQQLLLKHVSDATARKDSTASLPVLNTTGSSASLTNQTPPARDRTEGQSRDSLNSEPRDTSRRISNQRSSRESSPDSGASSPLQPLYAHGVCKWPGCDVECYDITAFYRHLSEYHKLDDKSTAQYRVQMQVVEQLEKQLNQERDRLDAMMTHLRMDGREGKCDPESNDAASMNNIKQEASYNKCSSQVPPTSGFPGLPVPFPSTNATSLSTRAPNNLSLPSSPISGQHIPGFPSSLFPSTSVPSSPPLFGSHLSSSSLTSGSRDGILQNAKRRHSTAVPISADLSQNQEFYRNADVRPPFTYASLIRQAIIETPDCQMTLNEIYNWFQKKFAYFRRNAPTWKSAIRTNLSLHKCFMRCEDVMGSYWTVDDREFRKGRHLKRGRPRKYEEKEPVTSRPQSPAIRGRMDMGSSQTFYGGPINLATMQMAFGDSSFNASQLASQAQAMFAANQLPNYSGFLPNGSFSGISHSISADASINSEMADNSTSMNALTSTGNTSVSPTPSNNSYRDEPRDKFLPSQSDQKSDVRSENTNGDSSDALRQDHNDADAGSPVQSRDEDMEERASRGSAMSDASAGEDTDKPLNLHNLTHGSNGVMRQGVVSARGSFAMLHDHPGAE